MKTTKILSLTHYALYAYIRSPQKWSSLDPFVLGQLIPNDIITCIQLLQTRVRHFLLKRRDKRMNLRALLVTQNSNQISLITNNKNIQPPNYAAFHIRRGDHIYVASDGVKCHHGIFLGQDKDRRFMVAEFMPMLDYYNVVGIRVQLSELADFMSGRTWVGIGEYRHDTLEAKENAAAIASAFAASCKDMVNRYGLHNWDCECIAILCKTGDIYVTPEDINRIREKLESGLSKFIEMATSRNRRSNIELMGNIALCITLSVNDSGLILGIWRAFLVVVDVLGFVHGLTLFSVVMIRIMFTHLTS